MNFLRKLITPFAPSTTGLKLLLPSSARLSNPRRSYIPMPRPERHLTPFQEAKLRWVFTVFYDADNTGHMNMNYTRNKFLFYMMRTKHTYLAHTGLESYWKHMQTVSDRDEDSQINIKNYLQMWEVIIAEKCLEKGANGPFDFDDLPEWQRCVAPSVFHIMDTSNGGIVSAEEYRRFFAECLGVKIVSEEKAQMIIDEMTENGKHVMDVERYKHLYANYYLSSDETCPSRHALGHALSTSELPSQYAERVAHLTN